MILASLSTPAPFGWWIASYFTLAAFAAGLVLRGALAEWSSGDSPAMRKACAWALLGVGLGGLCLIADLTQPSEFITTLTQFNAASWIAWGSRILGLFGILIAVRLVFLSGQVKDRPKRLMPVILAAAAFALTIYPALVLMQASARPLWNHPVLPVLFAVSAIHLGWAFGPSLLGLTLSTGAARTLAIAEFLVFAVFAGMQQTLLFHASSAWLWLALYLGLSILPPFLNQRLTHRRLGLLTLAGTLCLRLWILEAGQSANSFLV